MSELYRTRFEVLAGGGSLAHEIQVTRACGKWIGRIVTPPDRVWLDSDGRHPLIITGATREEVEHAVFAHFKRVCEYENQRIQRLNHSQCVGVDFAPARRLVAMHPIRFYPLNRAGRGNPKLAENSFTANVSETGLFIVTGRRLRGGAILEILLKLRGRTEHMQGEVVWWRYGGGGGRPPGAGVRLVDPPLSYRARVLNLA